MAPLIGSLLPAVIALLLSWGITRIEMKLVNLVRGGGNPQANRCENVGINHY